MKSANSISAMGSIPFIAAPTAMPAMDDSASGRIDHPILSERLHEAVRREENSTPCADVLAHHENAIIPSHLLVHGLANGLYDRHLSYDGPPVLSA